MVAGAKESEGEARHTGRGVRRFGAGRHTLCVLAAPKGSDEVRNAQFGPKLGVKLLVSSGKQAPS